MSSEQRVRAWVEVDGAALQRNVQAIRDAVGPAVAILPMVKADAYGLGVREALRVLEEEEPWGYGVATVEEGRTLRNLGVTRPILVCCPVPPATIPEAVEADLTLSISDVTALDALEAAARDQDRHPAFHVEVDTGMGRAGLPWGEAGSWAPALGERIRRTRWTGLYTHFHSADEAGDQSALRQWRRLEETRAARPEIPEDAFVHAANSAGVFRAAEVRGSGVRPGIFLYGGRPGSDLPAPEPVVSLRARVVRVQDVPQGATVGYGATYRAERPERWATLAIGYGDGVARAMGNKGRALLRGRSAPIIGRISMDLTVVDITDLEVRRGGDPAAGADPMKPGDRVQPGNGVKPGDVATLLGADGDDGIELEEVAEHAASNNYEALTRLSPRLPRLWTYERSHDAG